jgi:hypothetical protein
MVCSRETELYMTMAYPLHVCDSFAVWRIESSILLLFAHKDSWILIQWDQILEMRIQIKPND